MLTSLHIRDFAVIDELELHFGSGMTVLTGETGAGKSIIVDALGLILGDRADSTMLRGGAERCEISATFDIDGKHALATWLDEQAIPADDKELLIRRVLSADGRSRAFINGSPVAVQMLKPVGEMLIDIHGQHAHQSLLKRDARRQLLDDYGDYQPELDRVADLYRHWREVTAEIEDLSGLGEDREARLELLRYQVQELRALNPQAEEFEALEIEYNRLTHASRLVEGTETAYDRIVGDDQAIAVQLKRCERELRELARYDDSLGPIADLLEAAGIELGEAGDELRHYLGQLELDPQRLHEVEQRLSEIHTLARKHYVQPKSLPAQLDSLYRQLTELESSEERYAELKAQEQQILTEYHTAAGQLTRARSGTAEQLARAVSAQLHELGMPGGEFQIDIAAASEATPSPHGLDRIEFLVTTNSGQPPRPLAKVASGGELSRISLALQVIANADNCVATMIFDEVDAGIGGGVAEIVGKLLKEAAAKRQIFCVTHLPQVASLGHRHLRVLKSADEQETRIRVTPLSTHERIEEIARMLGGLKITERTRAHAKEMLTG